MQLISYIHNAFYKKNFVTLLFRLSVMPTKDLASFSYISPQKTLFSTIKYELTIECLSANG